MADKTLYYDIDHNYLVNLDSTRNTLFPEVGFNENPTWAIGIKTVSPTGTVAAVDVSDAPVWQFDVGPAINFNDSTKTNWCTTLDANIDKTNVATGILVPEIDSNTVEFLAGIGAGTESKSAFAELSGYTAGGYKKYRFRWEIRVKGSIASSGTPTGPADAYPTWSEADASYEPICSFVQGNCNFKAEQQNVVGVIPTGKLFRPTGAELLCTAISGAATLPSYQWLAGAAELTAEAVALNIGTVLHADRDELGGVTYYPAGTIFYCEITSAGTSTTHTGKLIIKGVMINA
jgi:hypothetical protein